jgi:hypothetical protein
MAEFVSFEPDVEVIGEVIRAFIGGFPSELSEVGMKILTKHGIENPQEGQFYPLQALLDSMREISEGYGAHMLYRIGVQIASNAVLPPGLDTLEGALGAIDIAYHMNHRSGNIGNYVYEDLGVDGGLRRVRMVCSNPYPCSFDRGVIEGFTDRFRPKDCTDVLVRHDDAQPCRKEGSGSCTYFVSWI